MLSTSIRCAGCQCHETTRERRSSTGKISHRGLVSPTTCSATDARQLKFSMSRYVLQEGKNNTNNIHPVIAATNNVSRTWTDSNRDFVVQGDPLNPALNGELAPHQTPTSASRRRRSASIRTGLPVSRTSLQLGNACQRAARAHSAHGNRDLI